MKSKRKCKKVPIKLFFCFIHSNNVKVTNIETIEKENKIKLFCVSFRVDKKLKMSKKRRKC